MQIKVVVIEQFKGVIFDGVKRDSMIDLIGVLGVACPLTQLALSFIGCGGSDSDSGAGEKKEASSLAAKRIGAIMVIERQIGLRNYIEGGIPLDAMFTYDLLASIFQPASPLHDGAVIVQGDRIAAAACFLPLSVNPRVSRDLGTRHRAALGLTEENDAIAVVVSEETGAISLAMGGDLERHLSADGLRTRLHTLLGHRRRRMRRAEEARSSLA
jgi:hypothetical protein